jgi:hypothetical protein
MVGNTYYTVVNDWRFDAFVVFRLHGDRIGDDVCYIESDLSERIWHHMYGDPAAQGAH